MDIFELSGVQFHFTTNHRIIPVNIRIIAATNKDLKKLVREGNFRDDLYYRISTLNLNLPNLNDRPGDLKEIAEYLINESCNSLNKRIQLSPQMFDLLCQYRWPGNVRELKNFIDKFILLSTEGDETANDELFLVIFSEKTGGTDKSILLPKVSADVLEQGPLNDGFLKVRVGTMEEMENQIIDRLNEQVMGNKNKLCKMLGVSRTTLWRKFNRN